MARLACLVAAACAAACTNDFDALGVGSVSAGSGASSNASGSGSGSGSGGFSSNAGGAPGSGGETMAASTGGSSGSSTGSGALGGGGAGGDPLLAVAVLDGARWELPCGAHLTNYSCNATTTSMTLTTGGPGGVTYDLVVRFRGVVEQTDYAGGVADGYFYTGGAPDNTGWNVYRLDVSEPPATYYLNGGSSGTLHCWSVDYQATFPIAAGADVTLSSDAKDGAQLANIDAQGQPIVVPGVSPAPQAYDGQFVQMNVLAASVR